MTPVGDLHIPVEPGEFWVLAAPPDWRPRWLEARAHHLPDMGKGRSPPGLSSGENRIPAFGCRGFLALCFWWW